MAQRKIGVIGCGHWGPNLIRNFSSLHGSRVVWVADHSQAMLDAMKALYPHLKVTRNSSELIRAPEVDAVCVATPVGTHYSLAKESLNCGKHVLVEKPFVRTSKEALELIKLARTRGRILMVDHTFLFAPAVKKMREIISQKKLGKILYLYSVRVNLGLFQKDINVVWDLAAHDISVGNYLLGTVPKSVCVIGRKLAVDHVEDVGFVFINYPNNILFEQHLSWLDPRKVRTLTVIGDKKMMVYDDLDANEPLKIYDRGASVQPYYHSFGEFKMLYRFGEVVSPHIKPEEPLRNLCQHFLDCIDKKTVPLTDGTQGYHVVKVLEAAQKSVKLNGKLTPISPL